MRFESQPFFDQLNEAWRMPNPVGKPGDRVGRAASCLRRRCPLIDEIEPAGLGFFLRLGSHPAQDLLRVGQEGERCCGRRRDARLAADDEGLLHRSPPMAAMACRACSGGWTGAGAGSLARE